VTPASAADVPGAALSDSELLEAWSLISKDADAVALWPPDLRQRAIKLSRERFPINGASIVERAQRIFETPSAARLPRVWLDDAEPDLTVDDYIKAAFPNGLVVVVGPSGSGKSFFVSDAMLHVACGLSWRERRIRQALVVWIAAEAGKGALRRFYAWREHHLASDHERVPFVIVTRGVNLLNPVDVEGLLLELHTISTEAGMPVGVVVFDTWSRSMPGGDENGAADTTQAIGVADRIRDELGAAVIAIHHTGKDPTKGARGHSSLFAAADAVITVADRVATIEKSRDGNTGEQFPFDLQVVELGTDDDGEPVTSCIVVPMTNTSAPKPKTPNLSGVARVALQALQEAIGEHGETLPGTSTIPAGVRAATIEAWRSRFGVRYGSDGDDQRDASAVRKAFQRGREALLKAGCITISDPYVWTA